MSTNDFSRKRYPAGRAFILQFDPAEASGEPVFAGRIEHVVSGSVQHFGSAEQLCAALRAMLTVLPNNNHG